MQRVKVLVAIAGSTIWVPYHLTHWGRVTHICVGNLTTIGTDNGLSPGRRQAIIWTNAGILLIRPSWTNFSEILIEIPIFSFKKMRLKVSSAKRRPFCLGLNVLIQVIEQLLWGLGANTSNQLASNIEVNTVKCHYCAVQFIVILQTALHWQ